MIILINIDNSLQLQVVTDPSQFFRCGTRPAMRGSNSPRFKNRLVSVTFLRPHSCEQMRV